MAISIDDDFARFDGKSYAINKINSVEVRERKPHGRGGAIILFCIAALLTLSALGQFASPEGEPVGTLLAALIAGGIGFLLWRRAEEREYDLFLMTSSSEAQAITMRDRDEVLSLREQIETAMARHSRFGMDR